MKLYPAIDLVGGKCVRLEQGRFESATVYRDDPVATAQGFAKAGAQALHVVDLDGARDPRERQLPVIERLVRHTPMAVQVGGGVRDAAEVACLLELGVARVIVGSLAVRSPELVIDMLSRFGADHMVVALDVRLDEQGTPRLATSGWQKSESHSLWEALARLVPAGLHTILCTDIARDGMLVGPSVELYRQIRTRYPALELLASGGVAVLDDLRTLAALGADGAIVGKALYAGRFTIEEALAC